MSKISVIISVFNAEDCLGQCLDTVLTQTLQDIEIICVENGSTDGSLGILQMYAMLDERLKIIQQEKTVQSVAWNNGLKTATGEFVCFMKTDDFYPANNILQNLYEKAKLNGVSICGGELARFNPSQPQLTQNFEENSGFIFAQDGMIEYPFYQFDEGLGRFIFSRQFLLESRLRLPEYMHGFEECFLVAALHAAKKFYALHQIVYAQKIGASVQFHWSKDKINDYWSAIIDNMKIAQKNSYYQLKDLCCTKLRILFPEAKKYLSEEEQFALLRQTVFLCDDVKKKVSIIVPVYNEEKYLSACLDSILNQSLKDIEIICVDDGSTDASPNILKEYAAKDSRIQIITQENKGLGPSRNVAFAKATGEYIQYVDSDDKITPEAAEYLYLYSKLYELDMLLFAAKNIDEKTGEIYDEPYTTFAYLPKGFPPVFSASDAHTFLPQMAVTSTLTLYRHEFLEGKNIQWESLHYEDTLFFTESILQATQVGILENQFYLRLMHSDSITGSINENYGDYCEILLKTFNFIKKLLGEGKKYKSYIRTLVNGKTNLNFIYTNINKDLLHQYVHYFLLKAYLILTTKILPDSQAKFIQKFYNLCFQVLNKYHINLPPAIESYTNQYARAHLPLKKKIAYFKALYLSKILKNSYSLPLFEFKSYSGGYALKILGIPLLSKKQTPPRGLLD